MLEYDTREAYSDDTPTISCLLTWLVLVLLCRIDCKAKQYKDISVTYLFLANNLNHIASIVRASGLRSLLGEEWTSGYEEKAVKSTAEAKDCFTHYFLFELYFNLEYAL